MSVLQALREGIGLATRHWRALLVVYLFNLLLAGAVALPVYLAIDAELAHTESAGPMAEGFDWLWYQEFISTRESGSDLSSTIAPWQQGLAPLLRNFEGYVRGSFRGNLPHGLMWLGVIYLLITTLLTGGILGLFAEEDARFTFRFFFDRAGRHFVILLGILVVALLIYWLLWNTLGAAHRGLVAYARNDATTEWTPVLVDWAGAIILMVLAFAVHMVMDYGRVASVAWGKLGLLPALLGALGFSIRNVRKTLGLFYLTTLLAAVIALVYGLLIGLGGGATTGQLIIMAVVQQAFILASIWIRMVYLGGQMSLYKSILNMPRWATPAGPPPEGEEDQVVVEETTLPA